MNFIKSSLLTGVATLIRIFSNLIITKIVASYFGTSGMVLLGQLGNLVSFVRAISTGGVQQGTVKLIAESEDEKKQHAVISASIQISIFFSAGIFLILIAFRKPLGNYFFLTQKYNYIFYAIAFSVVFYAVNIIFLSILNGKRQLKLFVVATILANLVGFIISLLFIYLFKIEGLLIAFSLNQSIAIISTIFLIKNERWFRWSVAFKKVDFSHFKKLFNYSFMALSSAILVPLLYILIRKLILSKHGVDAAGYWEALIRISSVFIIIMSTAYSTYLLPSFSALKGKELSVELFKIYKIVIPIAIVSALAIYLIKEYIVLFLYSDSFLPIVDFFKYQLIGDSIKIVTYVTAFLMIAKAKVGYYVLSECIQFAAYFGFSIYLVDDFGVEGVTMAYMYTAIISLGFQLLIFRKTLWVKN
mgnify:FL=1|jgi:PST family polysaccharide transporter|tara:strand:+ start:4374 stop:5621 length:1248 start_codon:yes stop_codon:yes gene_type:complete